MRVKRPDKYYKVEYVTDFSQRFYGVQFIAECLTLESATNAYKEAVQIHGWDSGSILIKVLATGTNEIISFVEIGIGDVMFEIKGGTK